MTAASAGPAAGSGRAPLAMLALIAAAELLGMAGWFAGGAAAHELAARWQLSGVQVAGLTSAVQVGFVAGTLLAAVLNLPDLIPSRWYFAVSAVLAGAVNAGLLVVDSYPAALVTRFGLGLLLAGVYPPAMKMAATWFRDRRGFAIGTVVGALTVGKASPYLVEALGGLSLEAVVGSTSLAALGAGLLIAAGYRDGPHAFPRRPFSWRLVGEVARVRELRLVTGGYLGHMWELYAFWGFIAAYWAASLAAGGHDAAPTRVAGLAFASIAIGVVGCLAGGLAADQLGRARVVIWSLVASGAAALLSAVVFGRAPAVTMVVIAVWGIAVIADSAQYSALVTEMAPAHAVGTALTLQTSLGFLLTMVAIQFVAAAGGPATRWAFPALAAGPAAAIVLVRRLARLRRVPAGH
ncbi:MAG: MFS transporter [Gemmatimonadales bacterium]